MRARMGVAYFEQLYADREDPWDLATSGYERDKYDTTIAALEGRRYGRALEVGCSVGVLTARLAAVCDRLLAVDAAPAAVARARARLAPLDHVEVERRTLPEEAPEGPWDLIVLSEVLYYWGPSLLRSGWRLLRETIAPGGSALLVHWRGPVRHYPLGGDAVHEIVLADPGDLVAVRSEVRPLFRLDRLDRPS